MGKLIHNINNQLLRTSTFLHANKYNACVPLFSNNGVVVAANPYIVATGGTVIQSGNYKVHIFSATDNFIVTSLSSTPAYNLLKVNVVAGGGGGGNDVGGGGSGGEFYENLLYSLSSGIGSYPCVVGAGGIGASTSAAGGLGSDSTFDTVTGLGGGGGGSFNTGTPTSGAYGGGAIGYVSVSQLGASGLVANKGGDNVLGSVRSSGGGGGGAGGNGANSVSNNFAAGGIGLVSNINGSTYSAGGRGTPDSIFGTHDGTLNTGMGGDASGDGSNTGRNGGSGIIVISYYSPISLLTSFVDWYNQVLSNGGSLTTSEQTYINSFFYNLGTDFTEFDRLWIHGVSNDIAARTSLANPTSTIITNVNSVLFTANKGFTGNAVNNYLDTNYNLSTSAVKYTQNSASVFVYSRSASQSPLCDIGSNGLTPLSVTQIYIRYNGDIIYGDINTNHNTSSVNSNGTGFYSVVRTALNSSSIYKNGLLLTSGTTASVLPPPYNLYVFCNNVAGIATEFSNRQISVSGTSSGVVNQLNFYNAIQMLGVNLLWAV